MDVILDFFSVTIRADSARSMPTAMGLLIVYGGGWSFGKPHVALQLLFLPSSCNWSWEMLKYVESEWLIKKGVLHDASPMRSSPVMGWDFAAEQMLGWGDSHFCK